MSQINQPRDDRYSKVTDVNWCAKVRIWADGINMWPDAVLTINHVSLGVQIACLGYLWVLRNVDKKYL